MIILILILIAYWLLSIYCLFIAIKNRDNLYFYGSGWSNFIRLIVCLIFAKIIFTIFIIVVIRNYIMNVDDKKIELFERALNEDIESSKKTLSENIHVDHRITITEKLSYQEKTLKLFKAIFYHELSN